MHSAPGFAEPGRMSLKSSFRLKPRGGRGGGRRWGVGGGGELQARAAKQGGEGRGSERVGFPLRGPGHQRFLSRPSLGWAGKGGDGDEQIHCLSSYVKHMISIPQIVPHPLPQVPCLRCIVAIKIHSVQKESSGMGRDEGNRRVGSVSQARIATKAEVAQI